MPQPAIHSPVLATRFAVPATTTDARGTFPVRIGERPYTNRTKGKRPTNIVWNRNLAAATAPGTTAKLAMFGVETTYPDSGSGVDANGRIVAGIDPTASPLNLSASTTAGTYVEKVKVSGGTGTGITPIIITNPGSGYDPASPPTVKVYWLKNDGTTQDSAPGGSTQATGTACVSQDGRVVGVLITAIGAGYVAVPTASAGPPVIGIAAPTAGTTATAIASIGQVTTVNTHIPHAAHAVSTAGGAFWFAVWRDHVIADSDGLLGTTDKQPTAAQCQVMGLDPDQHVLGLNTNNGFTEATGTHPDGTTTIGVLTLGAGIPNGETITVYRGLVKRILPGSTTFGFNRQMVNRPPAVQWVAVDGTAGATETSVLSVSLEPATL